MDMPYQIRSAHCNEWQDAMALAWKTFLRFEAGVYTQEGVDNFEHFITDSTLHRMFIMGAYRLYVALDRNKIIGMITLRDGTHISLLFVDEAYHRRGVARADEVSDRRTGGGRRGARDGQFFPLRRRVLSPAGVLRRGAGSKERRHYLHTDGIYLIMRGCTWNISRAKTSIS